MKNAVLIVIVCSLAFGLNMSALAQKAPKGLMLYLSFDEGKGNTSKDLSGNGYKAELLNGAKFSKKGAPNYGSGAEMVGGSSVATVEEFDLKPVKSTNEITIGAWFNVVEHNQWDGIVSIEIPGGDCCEYRLMLNQDPKPRTFWNMGQHKDHTGTFQFELKKWYHYAMTYDGKNAFIYVDGKKVDESTEDIDLPTEPGLLMVGTGEKPGTWAMESGVIDEVFVVNRELQSDELKDIMNKGVIMAVDPKKKLAITWGTVKTEY
ncbi:hypothetical protein CMK22_09350 [Candidatus Poribacteria bacterium]|nr:hypothetical protein [Candidatus Poribacteria bacterium]